MQHTRGIMLEGVSCTGKTSTLHALRRLHPDTPDAERSLLALGEHYTQAPRNIHGTPTRWGEGEHARLLAERLDMMARLGEFADALGPHSRRARGLFILLERFLLNHIVAYDNLDTPQTRDMEAVCLRLGLRAVLLVLPPEQMARRVAHRDAQMGASRPQKAIQADTDALLAQQEALLAIAARTAIPLCIIDTQHLAWPDYARIILDFAGEE